MRYIETLNTSVKALNENKVRSALTILGVVIGVFAVISLVSVGIGMRNYISESFDSIGSNLVFVVPGKLDLLDDPAKSYNKNKLAEKHVKLLETYAKDYIIGISPSVRLSDVSKYKTKTYATIVVGSSIDAPRISSIEPDLGRYFLRSELRSKAKVAVIGDAVYKELFGTQNPIGLPIKVGSETFEVVGTLKKKEQRFDEAIIIPYTTVMEVYDIENFSGIAIKVKDDLNVDRVIAQLELALLRDLRADDFTVMSQADVSSSIQSILGILTAALGAIAGISLLVGGIGIMNIMLVSVTERTREIGLRKALGATQANITFQFMVESILLSVTGGGIGLLLGWIASLILGQFVKTEVPLYAVVVAFGFSVFVGIVFGTYPAVKAGKKDPIEALRYE